jgi:undecaprenyl-diphosphatase
MSGPGKAIRRVKVAATMAEARVLVAVAMFAFGLWALLRLGGEMHEGETLAFDRALMTALRVSGRPHEPIGPAWVPDTLRDVTALGSTVIIAVTTTAASAALLYRGRWRRALVLIAVVVMAAASDELLKAFYDRPRPDFAIVGLYIRSPSFPSGHSTASAALWLTLAMIAASFETRTGAKVFWFALAIGAVMAVGFSRVYLGAHWPTDVLAGWILGAVWALIGWIALNLLSPRPTSHGGVSRG